MTVSRLPVSKAELGASCQLAAALGAGDGESGSALQTELRAGGVVVLAPGTPHQGLPMRWFCRRNAYGCQGGLWTTRWHRPGTTIRRQTGHSTARLAISRLSERETTPTE